jgi:hypothetical protein
MATLVVKPVDVNERDALLECRGGARERRGDQRAERLSIGQAGERIVVSEMPQLLLCGRIAQDVAQPVGEQRSIERFGD